MCRLLGVVSAAAQPLTELLADDLEPFTALSSVHCDGWGVAHRDARGGLTVRKAPEPARTSDGYREALARAHTDAALLHLRKASAGMANDPANTHPFSYEFAQPSQSPSGSPAPSGPSTAGRIAFAHNGWIGDMPALDAALAAADGPVCLGGTDSERYFGLVVAALRRVPPEVALTGVAHRLHTTMLVEALNCLLLTPDALYALTSYNPSRPTSSGHNPHDSYRLGFRATQDRVVVASSGWEHSAGPWEPLPNGQVLRVGRRDLHTSVHRLVPSYAAAQVEGRVAGEAESVR